MAEFRKDNRATMSMLYTAGASSARSIQIPSDVHAVTQVFVCKYPSCSRSYVSTDGVRKHCRKHHPQWLANQDEHAREGRAHNRSELYCVPRLLTADEAESLQNVETRKRQRTGASPTDLNRRFSEDTMRVDSPSPATTLPPRVFVTPHLMPVESPRGEIIFEHPWGIAVPMTPLRLDDDLPLTPPTHAAQGPPVFFNFNAAMPPPKRGASLGSSLFTLDPIEADAVDETDAAQLDAERTLFNDAPTALQADAFFASVFA